MRPPSGFEPSAQQALVADLTRHVTEALRATVAEMAESAAHRAVAAEAASSPPGGAMANGEVGRLHRRIDSLGAAIARRLDGASGHGKGEPTAAGQTDPAVEERLDALEPQLRAMAVRLDRLAAAVEELTDRLRLLTG